MAQAGASGGSAGDAGATVIGRPSASPEEGTNRPLMEERRRISTILHDDILQAFAVCLLKSQLCQKLQERGQHNQVSKELEDLEVTLNRAIDQVRSLNASLK